MTIDNGMSIPLNIYGRMFARCSVSGVKAASDENYFKATAAIAKDINRTPDILIDMKNAWTDVRNINAKILPPVDALKNATEVSEWKFFKNTLFEKNIDHNGLLFKADKTILETKLGKKIVESLGGKLLVKETVKETGETVTSKLIEGTAAAQVVGNSMAKITAFNVAFSSLLELPDLIKSVQNGDVLPQIGRSTTNVATGFASVAFFSSLFKKIAPAKFKSLFSLIGGAMGSVLSSVATSSFNDAVFGKSIASQKKAQEKALESQQNQTAVQRVLNSYNSGNQFAQQVSQNYISRPIKQQNTLNGLQSSQNLQFGALTM